MWLLSRVGKQHTIKKEQTKDALLCSKQNLFTWSQYFPCCTISSWIVIDTPFKSDRIWTCTCRKSKKLPNVGFGGMGLCRSCDIAEFEAVFGKKWPTLKLNSKPFSRHKHEAEIYIMLLFVLFTLNVCPSNICKAKTSPNTFADAFNCQLSSSPTWDVHRRWKSLKVGNYMHASSRVLGPVTQSLLKDQMA